MESRMEKENNLKQLSRIVSFLAITVLMVMIYASKTWAATDLGSQLVTVQDVCTNTMKTFDGDDGKPAVLVFGGISTCSNTNSALNSLSSLLKTTSSNCEVYAFDLSSNSTSTIASYLNNNGISVYAANSAGYSSATNNLYYICYHKIVSSGGYTMPLICYVDGSGNIVSGTIGYVNKEQIAEGLSKIGVNTSTGTEVTGYVTVNGDLNYNIAYKIFEKANQQRIANGVPALSLDGDLLNAAMTRSTECSIFYDSGHRRPTGSECFTVNSKVHGENIAFLYGYNSGSEEELAEWVVNAWMNSEGHRRNILNSSYKSIGIGVFMNNGATYFVQNFGYGSATTGYSLQGKRNVDAKIGMNGSVVSFGGELSKGTINVGETGKINLYVYPSVTTKAVITPVKSVQGNIFGFRTENSSVASIQSDGSYKGVGAGSTNLVAYCGKDTLGFPLKVQGSSNNNNNNSNNSSGKNGLAQDSNGTWYLYKNGYVDSSYTGLYNDSACGWWLVRNGRVDFDYNDLYEDANCGWWKVSGGAVDFGYTDLYNSPTCGWWKINGGRVEFEYNDLYNSPSCGWWKVSGGAVDFGYTDLYNSPSCGWWKVSGGCVDFGYTDLYNSPSCGWWKVNGGSVDFDYTDLYDSPSCGWWKVNGGSVDFGYTDLYNSPSCGWWKVNGGSVDFGFTDLYESPSCGWWKVNGGSVDFGYTGWYNSPSCGDWYIDGGSVVF